MRLANKTTLLLALLACASTLVAAPIAVGNADFEGGGVALADDGFVVSIFGWVLDPGNSNPNVAGTFNPGVDDTAGGTTPSGTHAAFIDNTGAFSQIIAGVVTPGLDYTLSALLTARSIGSGPAPRPANDIAVEILTSDLVTTIATATFIDTTPGVFEAFSVTATAAELAGAGVGAGDSLAIRFRGTTLGLNGTTNQALIDNVEFADSSVPEPGTIALLGTCLALFGLSRRRRQ